MLTIQPLNTEDMDAVEFDICIPCYEDNPKLQETIDALTNGPYPITVPAKLIVNVEKASVVYNRLACLAFSNAPYVLHMDDDVVFASANWDRRLLNHMKNTDDVGLVGGAIYNRDGAVYGAYPNRCQEMSNVPGAIMMCRKVQGVEFDDNYIGSQYEDTDICLQYRAAGLKVLADGFVKVRHYGGGLNNGGSVNKEYFEKKWGVS